ncbi:hypothetical protein SAMN05446037_10676 [Anaerovirgula multivorans]|uniref:Uncharacterized protein n=1 Tax=Anaerovirgula multivorans TaxID=312168 RepID=A0A239L725_9FIRM|nr:hypothetical protein [Anaerovirgula multivorans]SNT26417.1 hypothetical protein SAMN05446037_10676 [Anaerovirgula multivorans]
MYKSADVYTRLAYFAQYEVALWKSIPEEDRVKTDKMYKLWCVQKSAILMLLRKIAKLFLLINQSVGVVLFVKTIAL